MCSSCCGLKGVQLCQDVAGQPTLRVTRQHVTIGSPSSVIRPQLLAGSLHDPFCSLTGSCSHAPSPGSASPPRHTSCASPLSPGRTSCASPAHAAASPPARRAHCPSPQGQPAEGREMTGEHQQRGCQSFIHFEQVLLAEDSNSWPCQAVPPSLCPTSAAVASTLPLLTLRLR